MQAAITQLAKAHNLDAKTVEGFVNFARSRILQSEEHTQAFIANPGEAVAVMMGAYMKMVEEVTAELLDTNSERSIAFRNELWEAARK